MQKTLCMIVAMSWLRLMLVTITHNQQFGNISISQPSLPVSSDTLLICRSQHIQAATSIEMTSSNYDAFFKFIVHISFNNVQIRVSGLLLRHVGRHINRHIAFGLQLFLIMFLFEVLIIINFKINSAGPKLHQTMTSRPNVCTETLQSYLLSFPIIHRQWNEMAFGWGFKNDFAHTVRPHRH